MKFNVWREVICKYKFKKMKKISTKKYNAKVER